MFFNFRKKKRTKIEELSAFGQSIWLDSISRGMLKTGRLAELINMGLRGMTSNPTIFEQTISRSNDYDDQIAGLKTKGKSTFEIYDELTVKDIQDACDLFSGVYQKTHQIDGYVSLEINPLLANQIDEQIEEGLRLFKKVNRPNVMIKVPATREGFKVIEELIFQGVNVNVTLIFHVNQYRSAVFSYFNGLQRRRAKGLALRPIHSVASVFVSRIDTIVDKFLGQRMETEESHHLFAKMAVALGLTAVANSRVIYQIFEDIFGGQQFMSLSASGANVQRPLWGSTGTKNPKYSDIKYVTELMTRRSVNTIPEKTLEAFLDHGQVKESFEEYPYLKAFEAIFNLRDFGIDFEGVCEELQYQGLDAFNKSFTSLLFAIENKAETLVLK